MVSQENLSGFASPFAPMKLVILDTSAIRAYAQRDPWADRFHRLADHLDKIRITIIDGCLAELVAQIEEGRFPWDMWLPASAVLERIVDPSSPITTPWQDPSYTTRFSRRDREEARYHEKTVWQALLRARRLEDLRGIETTDLYGNPMVLSVGDARAVIDEKSAAFISILESMWRTAEKLGGGRLDQEEVARMLLEGLPSDEARGAEACARAIARFFSMGQARRTPYNPRSESRHGDAFDVRQLLALAYGAYIITEDKRLMKHVRASGLREPLLFSISEMVNALEAGTLDSA
jgi:hypothetical protein